MPESLSHKIGDERITDVRFRTESTADQVIARLLEAVRRTDLFLLTVFGDGHRVYPFGRGNSARAASLWCAELFWRAGASDMGWHFEVFLCRAEIFLDCPDGFHVQPTVPRRGSSKRRPRKRGAYGLDGAFGASSTSPSEL